MSKSKISEQKGGNGGGNGGRNKGGNKGVNKGGNKEGKVEGLQTLNSVQIPQTTKNFISQIKFAKITVKQMSDIIQEEASKKIQEEESKKEEPALIVEDGISPVI